MVIETCSGKSRLKHFAVTDAVIGAFYDVYNELGTLFSFAQLVDLDPVSGRPLI